MYKRQYEYRPAEAEPVPEGYVPFYISHYGRHGSRYHSSEAHYTAPVSYTHLDVYKRQAGRRADDVVVAPEQGVHAFGQCGRIPS